MIFYLLAPVGGGVGNEFVDLRSVLSRVEEVESPFVWNEKIQKIIIWNQKTLSQTIINGSSYHFLPVATGLTSNVENLMTGEWLNFPEEAAPIPGPAVDVWNFKTYLSSCFWRSIMQSSRRTTCNSIVRILRVSPIFIVNIPSYINRCSVKFKF